MLRTARSLKTYSVPEYYPDFRCKTSRCRRPCCEGWSISISMKDYFRLVGADCPQDLRAKLDCSLKVTSGAGDGCYARIDCDYNGRCRLHREDGLCALQKELGEEFLPDICRYYPRALHRSVKDSCVLSNSCEAVVEMLSRIKSPLKFTEQQMLIDRDADDRDIDIDGFAVQQVCIYIMQDRSFSLPLRLARLCDYIWSDTGGFTPDTGEALNIMRLFTRRFAGRISIADYCGTAVRYYDTECARQRGSAVFEDAFPDWQVLFEHLLVNHMLYDEFPYSNGSDTRSAFTALAAAYAFLRYIAIAVCSLSPGTDTLTDLIAAMFRFIEHSRFESAAAALLGELNYAEPAKLKNLILI